jgi:hypothetical protein
MQYLAAAEAYLRGVEDVSSVTLIGTPAKVAASIAGNPSAVPGILMKRLGLPPRW